MPVLISIRWFSKTQLNQSIMLWYFTCSSQDGLLDLLLPNWIYITHIRIDTFSFSEGGRKENVSPIIYFAPCTFTCPKLRFSRFFYLKNVIIFLEYFGCGYWMALIFRNAQQQVVLSWGRIIKNPKRQAWNLKFTHLEIRHTEINEFLSNYV